MFRGRARSAAWPNLPASPTCSPPTSTHFHPHPPTVNNAVMSQLILKPSHSSPRTPCTHNFKPRDLFFLLVKIFVWSNNSDAEATNTSTHSKAACHSRTTGYVQISKVYMDDFWRIFGLWKEVDGFWIHRKQLLSNTSVNYFW